MVRALLVLLLPLAGCSSPGPVETWAFGGSFAPGYVQADVDAVCDAAREHNPECVILTSDPPQFGFRFPSLASCDAARARVLAVPHVAHATPCVRTP